MSNTRLNLNLSSFMYLVCGFLIICWFLLIYIVYFYCFCLSHLFMLLLIFRSICCSFCFITKVNCWNIYKNLKADFIYFNLFLWFTVKGILCLLKNVKSAIAYSQGKTWKKLGFEFVGLSFLIIFSCLFYKLICNHCLLLWFGIGFDF